MKNRKFHQELLPAAIKEQRRHEREIYRENEGNQATKEDMTIGRGGLQIQGQNIRRG